MLAVVPDRDQAGVLELNYSWLPTWIGMNAPLLKEMEEKLKTDMVGQPMSPESLLRLHDRVIDFLEARFPHITGLRDYLEGLKFVELKG